LINALTAAMAFSDQHNVLFKYFVVIAFKFNIFNSEASVIFVVAEGAVFQGHVWAAFSVARWTVVHFHSLLRGATGKLEFCFVATNDFDSSTGLGF
jgi:hypothetical protein